MAKGETKEKTTKKAAAPKEKKPAKAKKAEGEKSGKRKKSSFNSYSSYIYKVLKQVHPDTGISRKAMVIMDNFINGKFFVLFC